MKFVSFNIPQRKIKKSKMKLSATFTIESSKDIKDIMGNDIEREMIKMLQKEIINEIDKEMLKQIKKENKRKDKELKGRLKQIDDFINLVEDAHKRSAKSKLRFP
jgi:small nuclear ribonucleoprotein (snRNP)-like protein